MQCVILAGGLATRMRPATLTLPKSLLPVAGKPFLDHQLRWLARTGVSEVLLLVGHLSEQIRSFAGDGSPWGISVRYSVESGPLLGTAGALRHALDQGLLHPRFLLTYGDSYLEVDFAAVFRAFAASHEKAFMTVFRNENQFDASNVAFQQGKVVRYCKAPSGPEQRQGLAYIDYGLLGFSSSVVEEYASPNQRQDLSQILEKLSREGALGGMEILDRFYEIGSPSGLRDLEMLLEKRKGSSRGTLS